MITQIHIKNRFVMNAIALVAAQLVFSSILCAQPAARLIASRISGPAPLAVLLDATDTRHGDKSIDTYRQLGYYFDFNDPTSGVWSTTGMSKNRETGGPLAGHVFDTPGVFQVGVRAQDAQGRWSDAWQTIIVTDPNTVFSGSNTIIISTGTDFTAAPAGSLHMANAKSWPMFQSGKRYLLKAGDDFSALGGITLNQISDFQVGSFGVGAQPIVSSVYITMDEDRAANPPRNGVIQNLDTNSIRQQMIFHHLLVYSNRVVGNGAGISNAGALDWYAANQRGVSSYRDWQWCRGVFIVDNTVDMNNVHTGPRNPIQGGAKWFTILGNRSTDANEHTLRVFYSYKSVIGHNEFTGMNATGGRHALKIHARGTQDWSDLLFPEGNSTMAQPRSRYIRVHNNILGNANSLNSWTLQIAPQDDGRSGTVEGLQDVLVESNRFLASPSTQADLQSLGSNIIERGNIRTRSVHTTSTFPSNYPNDASWHGPYYINDGVPTVTAPARGDQTAK